MGILRRRKTKDPEPRDDDPNDDTMPKDETVALKTPQKSYDTVPNDDNTMPSDNTPKTFLPQKSYFPLWKDGFKTWHINMFVTMLIATNLCLIWSGAIDRPNPSVISIDKVLDPSQNPVFRTMLLTTVALFVKTHAVMWAQVWFGCKNNSFSKNPYDMATGDPGVAPRKTEDDMAKTTMHHIHGNDLENIPYTLILHLLMVLLQSTSSVANMIMVTYTVARYIHTFWYAFYGSHEIRAILFSVNCFCNYAAVCQILAACGVL